MGKKRRLLSSKNKFAAKHSSHPRVKMFVNTTTTAVEAVAAKPTLKAVTEEVTTEVVEPVETVAPAITPVVEEPAPVETMAAPEPVLKKTKTKAKPATKKRAPARKTTRRSTKKKTITATT